MKIRPPTTTTFHHSPPQADPDPFEVPRPTSVLVLGFGANFESKARGQHLGEGWWSLEAGKDLWRWCVRFNKNTPLMIYRNINIYISICLLYDYQLILYIYNKQVQFCILLILMNFLQQTGELFECVFPNEKRKTEAGHDLWTSPRSSGRISSSHVTVPCFNKTKSFFFGDFS